MKVILIKDVKKMGSQGTIIEVSDGYANSFLIPRKMARVATQADITQSSVRIEQKEKKQANLEQEHLDLFKRLNKKEITIAANTNPNGHLFAAIKATDITSELTGLKPEFLVMKDSIKEIGQYDIPLVVGKNKGVIIANITR